MSKIVITPFDQGKTVESKVGDLILISLEAELSYIWELVAVDLKIIEFLDLEQPKTDGTGIGAEKKHNFFFKAKSLGTGSIQLKLRRHWESLDQSLECFEVNIQVSESTEA